jgi:hypothetical protein
MSNLTSLERQVIEMLLAGDDVVLAGLRQQLSMLRVSSRKMTGAGFFTELSIPLEVVRVPDLVAFKLGDVNGTAANVKHGLGFLLSVANGALQSLEGYTYDQPWPDEIRGLTLTYSDGPSRNMNNVRSSIRKT